MWLTFGASWCPDCRVEAPDIEAAYQANKDKGLAVVGVFISESADD
ncbi:MAG: cytochrome c biosis protein CcmG, thiol:disulfide interchange protein DsbE, partial [Chloroflexota bacterium]|nr:cytochrome c biosis protein CcmG, thiol:disulfide interchange protein DsbE [Chloroflexota bacterium]